MARVPAVGVDDDLPTRQAAIPQGAADDKPASGVDQVAGGGGDHAAGQHGFDDLLDHRFNEVLVANVIVMLR